MSLQKSKVGTLVLLNLLCGSILVGCSVSDINYGATQPLGSYKNTEGKDIKIYDIRAIEMDLAQDKNISVDNIDKFTNSLLVEVYKELEKGLAKADKSYVNERLLMVKDLHDEDMQMEESITTLMKIINDAFVNKTVLSESKFYDNYLLKRLEGLQSNPYDLLAQININDLSIKEAMIVSRKPTVSLDDKVNKDIFKYKDYAKSQLYIIETAIKDNHANSVDKLKSSVINLKTNLALLDLSGNTSKYTEMYDNMIIESFSKDVNLYDNAIRKLDILESAKDTNNKEKSKAKLKVDKYKKSIIKDLSNMKYEFEFGFDGASPHIEDVDEVTQESKVK